MLRWYLVRTKPNAEATALRNLVRQGYEVYFPRLSQSLPHRGRWRDRIVPLFPGYLFLGLDEGRQPLAPVRSTTGVACAVRFGSSYALVPDEVDPELAVPRPSGDRIASPRAASIAPAGFARPDPCGPIRRSRGDLPARVRRRARRRAALRPRPACRRQRAGDERRRAPRGLGRGHGCPRRSALQADAPHRGESRT